MKQKNNWLPIKPYDPQGVNSWLPMEEQEDLGEDSDQVLIELQQALLAKLLHDG